MIRKFRFFLRRNKILCLILIFLLLALGTYCFIEFYLNNCKTSLLHAYIRNPEGKLIQKFNKDINFQTFGELTSHCKNEAFNSSCYDVKSKGETVYRQMQLGLIRLLFIVDKVCRQHNIKYWIMKGTLIGAYRDNKMVPWDDDADISMLYEDYIHFKKIIKDSLPKDVSFQPKEEDEVHHLRRKVPQAKIRDENTCYMHCYWRHCILKDGAQLDIFIVKYYDENNGNGPYVYDETNLIVTKRDTKYNIPWNYISPTIEVEFDGIKLKAPKNIAGTLYYMYDFPWLRPFDPCPNRIPIPWTSCTFIRQMDSEKKNKLLQELKV